MNNGHANAQAGAGVWYRTNDPRNISARVPLTTQSNQTGELTIVLLAIRNHNPNENMRILSNSKYVIKGLTRNLKRWEEHNWIDTQHGELFQSIIAWMRWRKGKTTLKWVKGHSGIEGNEEVDKLASEGAKKPIMAIKESPSHPLDQSRSGAILAKLGQKDLYQIIRDKKKIPARTRTN